MSNSLTDDERRANFNLWFGSSKTVDDLGSPLVLHHGTTQSFDAFDLAKSADGGFHFGDEAAAGWRLANLTGSEDSPGNRVLQVHLAIARPLTLDHDPGTPDRWRTVIEEAKAAGHDGIRYPNAEECDRDDDDEIIASESWVAFYPWQIKSVDNLGHYNRHDHDLLDRQAPVERFQAHMSEALTKCEAGFHFEEGGCFGMALALREAIGGELMMRDDFVHAYVLHDGHLYDGQGQAPTHPHLRTVSVDQLFDEALQNGVGREQLDQLFDEALQNGVGREQLESDKAWAKTVIDVAQGLARNAEHEKAHQNALEETGFWGRAGAGSLVLSRDTGRLLIPHRSDKVLEPETWGTWGGAIDPTEDPECAARRELVEESGIDQPIAFTPLLVFSKGNFRYHNFLATVQHEFEPTLDWETQDSQWVDPHEIPHPRHPGLDALLNDAASWNLILQASMAAKASAFVNGASEKTKAPQP